MDTLIEQVSTSLQQEQEYLAQIQSGKKISSRKKKGVTEIPMSILQKRILYYNKFLENLNKYAKSQWIIKPNVTIE